MKVIGWISSTIYQFAIMALVALFVFGCADTHRIKHIQWGKSDNQRCVDNTVKWELAPELCEDAHTAHKIANWTHAPIVVNKDNGVTLLISDTTVIIYPNGETS